MRTTVLIGLATWFLASATAAAEPIELDPGDPRVRAAALRPHSATYQIFARSEDGAEQPLQRITRVAERRGDRLVVRWTTEARGTTVNDQVTLDGETLVPLAAEIPTQRDGGIAIASIEIDGRWISGTWTGPAGEALGGISHTLSRPAFLGSTDSLLLATLDLDSEAAYTWPTVSHTLDGVGWTTARVLGREAVALRGALVGGWRVAIGTAFFEGEVVVTDEAPFVLGKELRTPGGTIAWRLVE